jgi:hypothetical protein
MSERSNTPFTLSAPLTDAQAKMENPERRNGVRYPFTGSAEVYELRSKTLVTGRCSDLSAGGCYIDTLSPFPIGSAVKVRMERDSRRFEATAKVAYAHVQMGMGLSFTEVRQEYQPVLRGWLKELSGDTSPEPEVSAKEPENGATGANSNLHLVVNELVSLLVRKKILTEAEGTGLLRQMLR